MLNRWEVVPIGELDGSLVVRRDSLKGTINLRRRRIIQRDCPNVTTPSVRCVVKRVFVRTAGTARGTSYSPTIVTSANGTGRRIGFIDIFDNIEHVFNGVG